MSGYDEYDEPGPGNRRLVIAVIVAVVAIVGALLAGYLVHHGGGKHDPQRTDAARPPTTSVPTATLHTTESSSALSVPADVAPRASFGRDAAGVIVGYSHSRAGAIAAAGNDTAILYVQNNRTHRRELGLLTSIAATRADVDRMAGDFSSEDAALAKILDVADLQQPGVIAYGHPLGYQVAGYSSSAATIDVYVAGGQGVAGAATDSPTAGETFYEVDRVQLRWDGDWKMANWSHLVQNNGPELATVAAQGYLPFPIGELGAA